MKKMSQHTEWLSLVEYSGPFLAVPVLEKVFPQGLDALETSIKQHSRSAYNEWCDAVDESDPLLPELNRAWIDLVLTEVLELEDTVLHDVTENSDYVYKSPDGGTFAADYVLGTVEKPKLMISVFLEGTDLEKAKAGDTWPIPIYEQMIHLCRSKNIRLGLLTNGERWMLVNAPIGGSSSHISWYSRLWYQEPVTLKAFRSLLGVRRWFGPKD